MTQDKAPVCANRISTNYVSPFRTGTFNAVVTAIHGELVDIDVYIPGVHDPLHLRKLECGPDKRVRAK